MMETIRSRMYAAQHDLDKIVMDKFKATMRHAASLEDMRKVHQEFVEAKIRLIEATSDVNGLKKRNAEIVRRLEVERTSLEDATRIAEQARAVGREMTDQVKQLQLDHGERQSYLQDMAEGKTEHDIDLEIDAETAQLELIHAANPNILREFEKRAQEILRLQRKMEGVNTKLAELTTAQASLMNKFEPKLDDLVAQINSAFAYNFEQISCSGEVRVHKDEDFEQWALNIMVRFRCVAIHLIETITYLLTHFFQRKRNATAAHGAPPIRRRARRVHHLLPHGAAVARAVAVPRRRRDQPGHGPAQRAHGARAHGGDCLSRAHEPVLSHHAEAAAGVAVRQEDARAVHRERRVHAQGRREIGFSALFGRGAWDARHGKGVSGREGRCWDGARYLGVLFF